MSDLDRRAALKLLGVLPLAPLLPGGAPGAEGGGPGADGNAPGQGPTGGARAAGAAPAPAAEAPGTAGYTPRFFTPHEYATVRLLADMVIPADEISGSASAAGVPEYIDFTMAAGPEARRVALRGGLAWLDGEARRRSGTSFLGMAAAGRAGILDGIAWPRRAPASLTHGVAFFSLFRDLTAAGFFSSQLGHRDLGFLGNVPVMEWRGCGEAANRHALRASSS